MVSHRVKNLPKWGKFARNSGKEMEKCKKIALVSKTFLHGIGNKKFVVKQFLVLEETKHYICM
jgi:hypothetical protein